MRFISFIAHIIILFVLSAQTQEAAEEVSNAVQIEEKLMKTTTLLPWRNGPFIARPITPIQAIVC
jgi:hypothetical protein